MSSAPVLPTRQVLDDLRQLKSEALSVFQTLVLPNWSNLESHYNQTLYGYVLRSFSCVDLLSAFWQGSDTKQSPRIVDFLTEYTAHSRQSNSIAVQIWRHKLVHTARPRPLHDPLTGELYYWLLQWYEPHLSRSQHMTITEAAPLKILNAGGIYLIEDAIAAGDAYQAQLEVSPDLQAKASTFDKVLATYPLKPI